MATKRISFDWSILDRQGLQDMLYSLYPDIVGHTLKPATLHRRLSKHITQYLPVKVVKQTHEKVDNNYVYIGGTYFSDDDKSKRKSIEIIFVYNPTDTEIYITRQKFKRLCVCFADTMLHELIHMRQFRRRNFKYLPDYASNAEKLSQQQEQSYLGSADEIDAYGFNIACELLERFDGNRKKVIKHINKNPISKRGREDTWRMYLKAFDYDHNHEVVKKVKRKVIRYLDNAELGKPYRTKDWINR